MKVDSQSRTPPVGFSMVALFCCCRRLGITSVADFSLLDI